MKASPPPPGADVEAQKALLRRRFKTYRSSLSAEEHRRRSAEITDLAASLPELETAAVIHIYWPIIPSREIDTRPLILWLESMKKQIVMPVVRTFSRVHGERPRMTHVRYSGEIALRQNRWGVSEPSRGDSVSIERIDAVVAPALGAGRNGYRIGHGFGYYDEFLHRCSGPRICLVYEACLIDTVPAERHDASVDILVTEREVLRPARA